MTTETAQQWICVACGFVYDPAEGDPDGGIAPGTAFEDVPDDWVCPVCGAGKRDFSAYDPYPGQASIAATPSRSTADARPTCAAAAAWAPAGSSPALASAAA